MTDETGFQIFISHSSNDKGVARELCTTLESSGFKCWIAPRDIPPGTNYEEGIMAGISECPVFLLISTEAMKESLYVPDEVNAAKRRKKVIIPLMMEEGLMFPPALELLLSRYQWLDVWEYPNIKDAMPSVIKAVSEHVTPQKKAKAAMRSLRRNTEKSLLPCQYGARDGRFPRASRQ